MMEAWLWWGVQNTIAMAVLIPLMLLLCRVFRHRPAVQHVLWLIVLLKLLMPPVVVWPWSVEEVRDALWPAAESAALPAESATQTARVGAVFPVRETAGPRAASAQAFALTDIGWTWTQIVVPGLVGAWIIGMLIPVMQQLRGIVRYALMVWRAAEAPEKLRDEVQTLANQWKLRPPKAVVVGGGGSPFVWCLGRLRLVWPESLSNPADLARSRGVLAHELAHISRGDHLVAWLELIAGIVWWWNPLVWFVRRRLRETAEMACDALAISVSANDRREYAQLLLEHSAASPSKPAPILAIDASSSAGLERRLVMIMSDPVSGRLPLWGWGLAVGLVLLAVPGWSSGQQESRPPVVSGTAPAPRPVTTRPQPPAAGTAAPLIVQVPVQRQFTPSEEFLGKAVTRDTLPGTLPPKHMAVYFEMDERSYLRYQRLLNAGQVKGAGQPLAVGLSDESDFPRHGTLYSVGREFNPATGTIGVLGVVENADALLLTGMTIRVRLNFGSPRQVLEVPREAIQVVSGERYLWVMNDRQVPERRAVRIGASDGKMYVVEEGLRAQDRVVVSGARTDMSDVFIHGPVEVRD